jgi:hypothetical protein
LNCYIAYQEPGWRSRYSNWLRAGRPRGRSSCPGKVKNFISTLSRPALGPTGASFRGSKLPVSETEHSPPTSSEVKKSGSVQHGDNLAFTFLYNLSSYILVFEELCNIYILAVIRRKQPPVPHTLLLILFCWFTSVLLLQPLYFILK